MRVSEGLQASAHACEYLCQRTVIQARNPELAVAENVKQYIMEKHSFNKFKYIYNYDSDEKNAVVIKSKKHPVIPTKLYHYYKLNCNNVDALNKNYYA